MKIREVGEREFLRSISSFINRVEGARLGFDEDASDIPIRELTNVVVNVDTFVSSTDRLPGMTDAQVGRKTAVMVLSDLAAKGAKPIATMLSLCMPPDTDFEDAVEFVRGYSQYSLKNLVPFLGGDTGSAGEVILTGVALGSAQPEEIVLRSGSNTGDVIAVTGKFGLTSVGFRILLDGIQGPDSLHQHALDAVYKPEVNLDIIPALVSEKAVSSCMDSSDGLAVTLNTMASLSGLQFLITQIPMASGVDEFAAQTGIDSVHLVMNGGEEFHLVLTIPPDKWEYAQEIARLKRSSLIRVGEVREGTGVLLVGSSSNTVVHSLGYDSFRMWE